MALTINKTNISFPINLPSIKLAFARFDKIVNAQIKLHDTVITETNYTGEYVKRLLLLRNPKTGLLEESPQCNDNFYRTLRLLGSDEFLVHNTISSRTVEIGPVLEEFLRNNFVLESPVSQKNWDTFLKTYKERVIYGANSSQGMLEGPDLSPAVIDQITHMIIKKDEFGLETMAKENIKIFFGYIIHILKNTVMAKDRAAKEKTRVLVDNSIELLNNLSVKSALRKISDVHIAISHAYLQRYTLRNLNIGYDSSVYESMKIADMTDLLSARIECEKAIEYHKRGYISVVGIVDPELSEMYFQLGYLNESLGDLVRFATAYVESFRFNKNNIKTENKLWALYPRLSEIGILISKYDPKAAKDLTETLDFISHKRNQ